MKGSLLPSALLSFVVFSCLTLPLATLGSKPVDIKLQSENIFTGRLKDIATPYLTIAGLVSLGAGIVSLSVVEWRRSTSKSAQIEMQLLKLQQELKEKSVQIDELRLSESYLTATGLHSPVELETHQPLSSTLEVVNQPAESGSNMLSSLKEIGANKQVQEPSVHPTAIEVPIEVLKSLLTEAQGKQIQAEPSSWLSVQNLVPTSPAALQSGQASPAEANGKISVPRTVEPQELTKTATALSQVTMLQDQIKQMAAHIEVLQGSLESSVSQPVEMINPPKQAIDQLHHRLQLLELDWQRQQLAS